MANKIKPKRSYTTNSVPTAADLETNELAINWADGKAYTKNASGQIVSVTLGGSGGGGSLSGSVTIPGLGDQYRANVALMLHADGTGSTFVDSSPSPRTITAYGDATQSTVQSKWGGKSALFDASGDYLTVSPGIDFSSGDFVAEFWVYFTSALTQNPVMSRRDGGNGYWLHAGYDSGNLRVVWQQWTTGGTYNAAVASVSHTLNSWVFVSVVRSGDTLTIYTDGVSRATLTTSNRPGNPGSVSYIGTDGGAIGASLGGYLDDLRVTLGSDRGYTGSGVTVPTAAFPDSADLTLPVTVSGSGSSGLSWSSVPASATATGTAGQIAYDGDYFYLATATNTWKRADVSTWSSDPSFSSVILLLHFDGTNNATTFTDLSGTPKTLTGNGNAKISTAQSKFGGASLLLDGTGDWLSLTNNSGTVISSSQSFTIECWVYWTTKPTGYAMILSDSNAGASKYFTVNGSSIEVQFGTSAATTASASYTFSNATWHHLAVVRNGTTVSIYVDGVSQTVTNATQSAAFLDQGSTLYIGRFGQDGNELAFSGHIDDLRVTRGVARTITLPTAAYPDA